MDEERDEAEDRGGFGYIDTSNDSDSGSRRSNVSTVFVPTPESKRRARKGGGRASDAGSKDCDGQRDSAKGARGTPGCTVVELDDKENVGRRRRTSGITSTKVQNDQSATKPVRSRSQRLLAILKRVDRLGRKLAEYTSKSRIRASLRAANSAGAMSACLGLGYCEVDPSCRMTTSEGAVAAAMRRRPHCRPYSSVGEDDFSPRVLAIFTIDLGRGRMQWRWPLEVCNLIRIL